jgi:hypothetical protein
MTLHVTVITSVYLGHCLTSTLLASCCSTVRSSELATVRSVDELRTKAESAEE